MLIVKEDIPVKSLGEFFTELKIKVDSFKSTIEFEPYYFWYRGQSDNSWPLIPKIFRKLRQSINFNDKYDGDLFDVSTLANYEENIDFEFFSTASSFLNKNSIPSTRWNRYYLKQHYGLNTRLLDWTQNVMVALYFALSESQNKDCDARIWILSPFHLNKGSLGQFYNKDVSFSQIFSFSEDDFVESGDIVDDKGKLNYERLSFKYMFLDSIEKDEIMYPLAIKPTLLDDRMKYQQACFTIFSNKINGISQNTFSHNPLIYIDIDRYSKIQILNQLSEIGFDQYFVYPDLDGLCQMIENKHQSVLNRINNTINLNQSKRK